MEITDLEFDNGDVKLHGCHTPLDQSKRTDLSKTTNLLRKQEVSKRLWEKVVGRAVLGLQESQWWLGFPKVAFSQLYREGWEKTEGHAQGG